MEDERTARERASAQSGPELTERQRSVLRAVVEDYVLTAIPVGSKALVQRYGLGVSPATVRSSMAELEALGLLTHPHTSAGRVPSDLGYRLYVEALMRGCRARHDRPADDPSPVQPGLAHEQRLAAACGQRPGREHACGIGRDAGAISTSAVRPRPARGARRRDAPPRARPRRRERPSAPPRPQRARAPAARGARRPGRARRGGRRAERGAGRPDRSAGATPRAEAVTARGPHRRGGGGDARGRRLGRRGGRLHRWHRPRPRAARVRGGLEAAADPRDPAAVRLPAAAGAGPDAGAAACT